MDGSRVKLAAGWLIEHAGWKGYSGEASVHEHQALVLTNPKRLKGGVVMQLAEQIIASVHAMFGVELEAEPRIYP
jgi:UDP-N-acetylmuramate dehydrogenase